MLNSNVHKSIIVMNQKHQMLCSIAASQIVLRCHVRRHLTVFALKKAFLTDHCIVFTNFQRTKLYSFHNFSLKFFLQIFLIRKFQPRYSYKIYPYKKERVYSVSEYWKKPFDKIITDRFIQWNKMRWVKQLKSTYVVQFAWSTVLKQHPY